MKEFFIEAVKHGVMLYILGAIVVGILLTSCSNEGAGFKNTGRRMQPACVDKQKSTPTHQVWKSCP